MFYPSWAVAAGRLIEEGTCFKETQHKKSKIKKPKSMSLMSKFLKRIERS